MGSATSAAPQPTGSALPGENKRTESASVAGLEERFSVEPMTREDLDECVELTVESFMKNNPVIIHLKTPESELREQIAKDTKVSLEQGLPMVARDRTNGKLAGFLFLCQFDPFDRPKRQVDAESGLPISDPVFEVIEKLYVSAFDSTKIGASAMVRGKTLRVAFGATSDSYQGVGVGKLLRCSIIKWAEDRGFERVVSEPIHPATLAIWTKHAGFHVRARTKFADYPGRKGVKYAGAQNPWPFQGLDTEAALVEGITKHGERSSCCCCNIFWFICLLCGCKSCLWTAFPSRSAQGNAAALP